MALVTTSKYFVLTPTADNLDYLDFDLSYGALTMVGQNIRYSGSSMIDTIFVSPGLTYDFTGVSGGKADKIYFTGNLVDYMLSQSGSSDLKLTGTFNGLQEIVVIPGGTALNSENLIFANGTVNSNTLYNSFKTSVAAPTPTGETSKIPLSPSAAVDGAPLNATIKAFSVNPAAVNQIGETFATTKPGIKFIVSGSTGIDTVYVADGANVTFTVSGASQDLIYMRGNWVDYSKTLLSNNTQIQLTRLINGVTESVIVSSGTNVNKDMLIFKDGAINTFDAKTALTDPLRGLTATVLDLGTAFNNQIVTPGLNPHITAITAPALNTAKVGDVLDITVYFDQTVMLANGKTVTLKATVDNATGGGTTDITLTATGTGTAATNFHFFSGALLTAGLADTNGITIKANSLALGAGTNAADFLGANALSVTTSFNAILLANQLVDTNTAPAPALLSLLTTSNSGSQSDFITNDTTPTIHVALATQNTGGAAAVAGDQVIVSVDGNAGTPIALTEIDITRAYVNVTLGALSNATHNITATVTDMAGNVSDASLTLSLLIDAAAPAAPQITAVIGAQTVNDITYSYNNTPTVTGKAEVGSTVTLFTDLNSNGQLDAADLIKGSAVAAIADAQGNNWSITLNTLADGIYPAINAVATDMAGNFSAVGLGLPLMISTEKPYITSASFTEGANASISITYSEAIKDSGNDPFMSLYVSSGADINRTGFSVNGNTLTFNTSNTFAATDIVIMDYSGFGGVTDLADNYPLYSTLIIGGSGTNTLQPSNNSFSRTDIIAGNGADIVYVSSDSTDYVVLTESIATRDSVVVGSLGESTFALMDNIIGFDVSGSSSNDILYLPSSAIAANTVGYINGINAGLVKSHSISNGILTFGATDSGTPLTIGYNNLSDVQTYLTKNLTTPGNVMAFAMDADFNGIADSLVVFENIRGTDTTVIPNLAIMLDGLSGITSLSNASGSIAANVLCIGDVQGPMYIGADLSSNGVVVNFDEIIGTFNAAGVTLQRGNGAILTAMTVSSVSANANHLTLTTDTTLSTSDYVLLTPTDRSHQFVNDVHSNQYELLSNDINMDPQTSNREAALVIGGAGDTLMDISAFDSNDGFVYMADTAGGNDTLISGTGTFGYILLGGAGNDTLDASHSSKAFLNGGTGVDKMKGSIGDDKFQFQQGDSSIVNFADLGSTGLDDGDTFFFNAGADIILSGFGAAVDVLEGDKIKLISALGNDLLHMDTIPLNGLVTDQAYFFQKGSYADVSGIFTVNSAGTDAMVVYDGDATAGVSQTALVLTNVGALNLVDQYGTVYIQ